MRNAMDAQEVAIGWWPEIRGIRQRPSTRMRTGTEGFGQAALRAVQRAGTPSWASTSLAWTTSAQAPIRALRWWSSFARHSRRAWYASGIWS
jgi:hypothetical protein